MYSELCLCRLLLEIKKKAFFSCLLNVYLFFVIGTHSKILIFQKKWLGFLGGKLLEKLARSYLIDMSNSYCHGRMTCYESEQSVVIEVCGKGGMGSWQSVRNTCLEVVIGRKRVITVKSMGFMSDLGKSGKRKKQGWQRTDTDQE